MLKFHHSGRRCHLFRLIGWTRDVPNRFICYWNTDLSIFSLVFRFFPKNISVVPATAVLVNADEG